MLDQLINYMRLSGDREAVQGLLKYVIYLMSIDDVVAAYQLLASAPVCVKYCPEYRVLLRSVVGSMRHVEKYKDMEKAWSDTRIEENDLADEPKKQQAAALDIIEEIQPGFVIDYGCGSGLVPVHAALRVPGCRCLGVDIEAGRVQASRERATRACVNNQVEFCLSEERSLGTRNPPTVLVMTEILEHVKDAEGMLLDIVEWCQPDHILLSVPDLEGPDVWSRHQRFPALYLSDVSGFHHHVRAFSAHDLVRLSRSAGFGDVRQVYRVHNIVDAFDSLFVHARFGRHPEDRVDLLSNCASGFDSCLPVNHDLHIYGPDIGVELYNDSVWYSHSNAFDPLAATGQVMVMRPEDLEIAKLSVGTVIDAIGKTPEEVMEMLKC